MNILKNNEVILERWKKNNDALGEHEFAPDGIMYRGLIAESGVERKPDNDLESKIWETAPLRILFLTKDQNSGAEGAWDVRAETGRTKLGSDNISGIFSRNLMYQLYGLVNTTPSFLPEYDFTNSDAIKLYDSFPLARINVKKESGCSSVDNQTLRTYLDRDESFISLQIDNLDADIIVCCGYSQSIDGTGNLLLNFLNNHGYNFQQQEPTGWIYYDVEKDKVAVNNFHLSARKSSEKTYRELTSAYQAFLKDHPDFIKPHR